MAFDTSFHSDTHSKNQDPRGLYCLTKLHHLLHIRLFAFIIVPFGNLTKYLELQLNPEFPSRGCSTARFLFHSRIP